MRESVGVFIVKSESDKEKVFYEDKNREILIDAHNKNKVLVIKPNNGLGGKRSLFK